MKLLARGVLLLDAPPLIGFNVYLVDDVLFDTGSRYSAPRILRQLGGRPVSAVALSHVHPDHCGGAAEVCEALDVPLWCGDADADAMESGSPNYQRSGIANRFAGRLWCGPGHPVARRLREGDAVGSFTVLETPGHTPGHIALWREHDRVLLAGEVRQTLANLTPGVNLPPQKSLWTGDPARNRVSAERLEALRPRLSLFAHGPPVRA